MISHCTKFKSSSFSWV